MATVRISGNWRNINRMDWAGVAAFGTDGHIERSLDIPEEAYQSIEREIAKGGGNEGTVFLADGVRFSWFLDR